MNKEQGILFGKSIAAGVFIALAAVMFLTLLSFSKVIAALGFSIGLLCVFWTGAPLYTGRVGFATSKQDWFNLIFILIGNIIGASAILLFPQLAPAAAAISATKVTINPFLSFAYSIICGMLIHIAALENKKNNTYASLIIVPSFILAGAEHCIANMCFGILGKNLLFFAFILLHVIGNCIGAKIIYFLTKQKK